MKKLSILILTLMCIHSANAQKVHAFLFCKTNDRTIGNSVRINFANMKEQIQTIANALEYEYVEHSVTGTYFTVGNVSSAIQKANIGRNDIVFLYFSTHGVKSEYDSNIFPQLDIPEQLVSAYKQHNSLASKNPKFILTAIEACSGYQNITPQEAFVYEQSGNTHVIEKLSQTELENIKKLFSNPCNIIVTAGNPGKNTWATPSGSMFTNCFLRSMSEYISMPQSQNVSWDNILKRAKQYTWDMTQRTRIQYYPVWETNNCKILIPQSHIDTTLVKDYGLSFDIKTKKTRRIKNPYDVSLSVLLSNKSEVSIQKVVYYLHYTMENPIVEVEENTNNFFLSLAVWGEFPIKAKVHLSNGEIIDIYKDIVFKK